MRGMHEATPVADTYCSGLGAIEDLGSDLRFYLYVLQTPEDGGPQERILVEKLIMPKTSAPDVILQILLAIGGKLGQVVDLVSGALH